MGKMNGFTDKFTNSVDLDSMTGSIDLGNTLVDKSLIASYNDGMTGSVNEFEHTGTTIVAMTINDGIDDGVIIAADSRTSAGTYVMNRVSNKLTKLTDKIYCCRSGRSSHTQAISRIVSRYSKRISILDEKESRVKDIARITNLLISENDLTAAMIIAGYDDVERGSVYSIKLGGTMIKRDWAIGGSGSAYLYGHCDSVYRNDMTFKEKFELTKNLVGMAIKRDNSSGGCVRMAVIR